MRHLAQTPAEEPEFGAQRRQGQTEAAGPGPVAPSWALQPGPGARLLTLHQPVPGEGGGAAGD